MNTDCLGIIGRGRLNLGDDDGSAGEKNKDGATGMWHLKQRMPAGNG